MSYSKHVLIAASLASFALAQNQGQTPSKSQTEGQRQSQSQTDSQSQRDKSSSSANSASTNRLSASESRFVQEALESNQKEVEMGRLALSQASDAKVKSFAQRLVNDHTAAYEKLEDIAKKNGIITASTGEASRSATDARSSTSKSQTEADRTPQKSSAATSKSADTQHEQLAGLRGAQFDREFVQMMVQNHQAGVAKYEAAQKEAMNADLKSYISSTLPTLREHLKQAQAINTGTK